MSDRWRSSSFDAQDDEPLGPLANLVDIMLVFACGLIAALVAVSPELKKHFKLEDNIKLERSQELTDIPESLRKQLENGESSGYQSMGQVYRDPQTGKLILIGQ